MIKTFLIFLFFITLINIECSLIGIHLEKKDFNNGQCPICGRHLRHFDTDSLGRRGYICDKCFYSTWVSYKSVDRCYLDQLFIRGDEIVDMADRIRFLTDNKVIDDAIREMKKIKE